MNKIISVCVALCFLATPALALSTAEIKRTMIDQSIRSYSGNCPCPFNRAKNGSKCGKRSAWSRPGGASPICYESDISNQMLENFIRRNGISRN